jgi:hypothetical protein
MIAVGEHLASLEVGDGQTYEGLTLFPVSGKLSTLKIPDYLTLDAALEQKKARVEEISQSGAVPELRFINLSARPILLLDGEELVGAKQNRVLNVTILVPPETSLNIPVSCVEKGRWAYKSESFSSSGNIHHASGRARRVRSVSASRAASRGYQSNQGEVWSSINLASVNLGSLSTTSAMSDIYRDMGPRLEGYREKFSPSPGQTGLIACVPGKVIGVDLFDHHDTFTRLFEKLVRSYALDALMIPPETEPPPRSQAVDFLQSLAACPAQCSPSVGEGDDIRMTDAERTAAGLIARCRIVHLNGFQLLEKDPPPAAWTNQGPQVSDAAIEGIPLPRNISRIAVQINFNGRPAPADLAGIIEQLLAAPAMRQIARLIINEVPGDIAVEKPGHTRWTLFSHLIKVAEKARKEIESGTEPENRFRVSAARGDEKILVTIDDGGDSKICEEFTAAAAE